MNRNRFMLGFGWGIVATIVMSLVMLLGMMTGISPMPKPIPVAIVAHILGETTAKPLLMFLAIVAHLAYGGIWAGLLTAWIQPITVWKGIGLGILLWLIMQIAVLPFLGWGIFGSAVTPAIALATLVLHLIYGIGLGWLIDRNHVVEVQPT